MCREAHLERADRALVADPVEDDHTPCTAGRDEARERVDQLVAITERPGVQQVVAVEEVQRRVSHRASFAGAVLRRGARRPPRRR